MAMGAGPRRCTNRRQVPCPGRRHAQITCGSRLCSSKTRQVLRALDYWQWQPASTRYQSSFALGGHAGQLQHANSSAWLAAQQQEICLPVRQRQQQPAIAAQHQPGMLLACWSVQGSMLVWMLAWQAPEEAKAGRTTADASVSFRLAGVSSVAIACHRTESSAVAPSERDEAACHANIHHRYISAQVLQVDNCCAHKAPWGHLSFVHVLIGLLHG